MPGYYPAHRYAILLNNNYFTPEYAISPLDVAKVEAKYNTNITSENFSYAMLMINDPEATRNNEWGSTTNEIAPVLSDRNLGGNNSPENKSKLTSIHDSTQWRGAVAYNDNHVEFEGTNLLRTQYTGGRELVDDDIFTAGDGTEPKGASSENGSGFTSDDAAMVYHDDSSLTDQK